MTKIYLIHGWGGTPNSEGWFGWIRIECKKRKIELEIPEMPNTNYPKIGEWVKKLNQIIKPDKNTYLIGHSIGCQAIIRYLERLQGNTKFKGLIFIAGWFNLLETAYENEKEKDIAKPWLTESIDLDKVKRHSEKILAIFSDDDPCVPLSDSKIFKEKLNAEIIIKHNQGHFNETKELNEIFDVIK